MARGKKPTPVHQSVTRKQQDSKKIKFNKKKKFIPETQKKGKPKCLFCGNLGHEETQCPFKQKASVKAQKKAKFKTETHKNNVIDMDEFERLDELPETQEFMEHMDMEVRKKDLPHHKVKQDTNNLFTTGLILEISVAIILSSESDVKSILLNMVLIDAGCTRTIVKQNKLPNKFFECRKQLNEVSWTTNAGNFVTTYNIPLQFSLPEFAPSRKIKWNVAVDDTSQQSKYDMIIGQDLQLALGMDILSSTKHLKWDGICLIWRHK
jgi:hypothetical protein